MLALASLVTDIDVVPEVVELVELSVVLNVSLKDHVLLTNVQDCDPLEPNILVIVQENETPILTLSTL
tara:strand:- start:17 stop:220 length:204 start_codon:yes stop_codon:yes gene_type:complete